LTSIRVTFVTAMLILCVPAQVPPAFAAGTAESLAQSRPKADVRKHPTDGKTPIEITVGMYITNLVAIDETRENFEVGGYLEGQWVDPRLAIPANSPVHAPNEQNGIRMFEQGEIWAPGIETANSITHKRSSYTLQVDRNGVVTYVENFDAVLSNLYNLRKFPFDRQVLQFEFQPFLASASEIRFAEAPLPLTGISPDQHLELAWLC